MLWKNINKFPSFTIYVIKYTIPQQVRCKHGPGHWSVISKKKLPVNRALEHFDDFYKNVYGAKWPSIRIALLSPHKYCAIVNNFGDAEQVITDLQNEGALNMRTLFELERDTIKNDKEVESKNRDLDKIYKLDKQLERIALSKEQEEISSLYPDKSSVALAKLPSLQDEDSKESAKPVASGFSSSLRESLDQAEHDDHRLIDPASGLSAAALYEFVPATRLKGMEDWVPESEHYAYYGKGSEFPVRINHKLGLSFPKHLKVFTFERGNVMDFKPPRICSTGALSYYLLDGASVLPVLALDLQPGDKLLDMCAAPGGKSVIALQTLFPDCVVCNDVKESRVKRIRSVINQYLYDSLNFKSSTVITQSDGRFIDDCDIYNKILVDVPCTTDRHVLFENDNNIFRQDRTKERIKLPETQAALLTNALKLVSRGGTVVYCTCSLSPIQNDGVVHMALKKIWEDTNIEVEVGDLTSALKPFRDIFRMADDVGLKYGNLVLPFLPNNFGPLYFCKLIRRT